MLLPIYSLINGQTIASRVRVNRKKNEQTNLRAETLSARNRNHEHHREIEFCKLDTQYEMKTMKSGQF